MLETVNSYDVYYGNGEKESFSCDIDHYINSVSSTTYSPDLVIIRGSSGTTEWLSNFNLLETTTMDGTSLHSGFWKAASTVYNSLYSYLNDNWDNTVFVLTGHSRGAAAANILEKYLVSHNGVDQSCIYGYNIACPDVAAGSDADWNPNGAYGHIFNLANAKDIVSLIPGALGNAIFDKGADNWGKFGRSYWFTENEGDIEINPATHELSVYLDYFKNEYPLDTYKSRTSLNIDRIYKVLNFGSGILGKSPVNIMITDESGGNVLSLVDGEVNLYDPSAEDNQDIQAAPEGKSAKGRVAVTARRRNPGHNKKA